MSVMVGNLRKVFAGAKAPPAVNGVSFTAPTGGITNRSVTNVIVARVS